MSFIIDTSSHKLLSNWVTAIEFAGYNTSEMKKDLGRLSQPFSSPELFIQELTAVKYRWHKITHSSETCDLQLSLLIDEISREILPENKEFVRRPLLEDSPKGIDEFCVPIILASRKAAALPQQPIKQRTLLQGLAIKPERIFTEQSLEEELVALKTRIDMLRTSSEVRKDAEFCSLQIEHAEKYLAALMKLSQQRETRPKSAPGQDIAPKETSPQDLASSGEKTLSPLRRSPIRPRIAPRVLPPSFSDEYLSKEPSPLNLDAYSPTLVVHELSPPKKSPTVEKPSPLLSEFTFWGDSLQ